MPVVSRLSLRSVSKAPANENKERPLSTMSDASNPTGGSDCAANSSSPAGRVSDTHGDGILPGVTADLGERTAES